MSTAEALVRRRTQLSRAWSQRASGGAAPGVRTTIRASWDRSALTVPVDLAAAPMSAPDDVARAWEGSPLSMAVARLEPQLAATAREGGLVVAVTDPGARILWTSAGRVMRQRAEAVGFAPGGRWDEASVGTNALDLSARTGASATVWSAEHYAPLVQGWVCWAAPVRERGSGALLGVVDLSTTWDRAQALGPATASALALLLTEALPPAPPAPDRTLPEAGAGVLRLRLLGPGSATWCGRPLPLTRRQLEVLALLSLHPEGLSRDALHAALYGDAPVSASTLKAEVSHLRTMLDGGVGSRPYRLDLPVRSDLDDLLAAVRSGDVRAAVAAGAGPLLEGTESPELRQAAQVAEVALREALLARPEPDAVLAYAGRCPWDEEVLAAALAAAPVTAGEHALLAARLRAARG